MGALLIDQACLRAVREFHINGYPPGHYAEYAARVELLARLSLITGIGSMVLCGVAWRIAIRRWMVVCVAVILAPFAFHFYDDVLLWLTWPFLSSAAPM